MDSINDYEELKNASPESVKFHGSQKGIPHMLVNMINAMPFWNVEPAAYTGNIKVIYECFQDCLNADKRPRRKNTLTKPGLVALNTIFFDSDYREFFNRLLFMILQRQDELVFPPHHNDPLCWTDDQDNRVVNGAEVPADLVVLKNNQAIVLKEQLPPRKYWITIERLDRYYAIDSNRPVFVGSGWAYALLLDYGTREQFNINLLSGDPL